MDQYYKLDILRLPVRLVWRSGNRSIIRFAIRKFLRVPWFGPVLVPAEPVVELVLEGDADGLFLRAIAPASAYFAETGSPSFTRFKVRARGTGAGLAHGL